MTVPAELAGWRLDKAIAELLEVSRAEARRLFEEGEVRGPAGDPASPAMRVGAGQVFSIDAPARREGLRAEPVEFGVLYEDEHLAVIDKPSGLVVHPGAGNRTGTLVSGLLARWAQVEGVGEFPRWGIVHRLDRETSGAMVVALTGPAHTALQELIGDRRIGRRYLALVHGRFATPTGSIDAPIDRHPTQPTRKRVAAGGRPAVSDYTVLAEWEEAGLSLVEVRLRTGRTHQIRVHMESIGHPVVGDAVYGRPAPAAIDPGRVWLHSARLEFTHPLTGAEVSVAAPLPAELSASLAALGPPTHGRVPAGA